MEVVMDAHDRLLKRKEAAKIIGFSESYLEKCPTIIPIVRIGRSVRYRLSDLLRIVENQNSAAPAQAVNS